VIGQGPKTTQADGRRRKLSTNPSQVGTFSTAESFFSFSGATLAISAITAYTPASVFGVPLIIALCVIAGLLIYAYNTTDPTVKPQPTTRDRFFAFILAAFNTFQLYLACTGAHNLLHK
jgi:hypothetical protein